jgi:hypothetical protein
MPTFFSRRYVRGLAGVGTTEKCIGTLILLLTAGIVAVFVIQSATDQGYLFESTADTGATPSAPAVGPVAVAPTTSPAPPTAADPAAVALPDPGVAGWRPAQDVGRFAPDDLYLKIDGRDELYLRHHVVRLTFASYPHESDEQRTIDVYWYVLQTAEDAANVYREEAPPKAPALPLGDAAYQAGGAVFFRRGANYLQVLPSGQDPTDADAALTIARRLVLAADSSPPP